MTLVTFAVYVSTLAPSVTSEDSGELITAVARWGVAHPPGYPLYCLVAKLFLLVPVGSVAHRVNLASAFFGALAAGATVLLSVELALARGGPHRAPARSELFGAALAGLFVAGARDVWAQSVVAEVYSLNTLFLVAILLVIVRGTRLGDDRYLLWAAGLHGLSLSHHYPLMALATPSLLVHLWRGGRPLVGSRRRVAQAALLVLLGLSVYVYLPLAARGSPPLNWGDPSSLDRLLAHVSRSAYRKNEMGNPITLSDKLSFAWLFVRLFAAQWTAPVLAILAPLGVVHMRDRARERDLLLGVMGVTALGLIVIPGYTYDAENIQRFDELYLPVYVGAALFMAEGCVALGALAERLSPAMGSASWVLSGALALVPFGLNHSHCDLSDHRLTEKFNRFILESLEPNAVYVTAGDYTSFPALYLQAVEGVRPDVLLANYTGELSPAAVEYVKSIDTAAPLDDRSAVQRLMVERGSRPFYIASKSDLHISARTEAFGFVYRVKPLGLPGKVLAPDILSDPILGSSPRIPGADDLARGLVADYLLMLGEAHAQRGERSQAIARYMEAAKVHSASKETVNNVASTCAERGFHGEAEELMRRAAALSPTYVTPRRNLAKLLDSQGRRDDAITAFEELLKVTPDDKAARGRLEQLRNMPARPAGSATPRAPQGSVAPPGGADPRIAELVLAIEQAPTNPALHNNLGNVLAESGDFAGAKRAYEEALRVDPKYALAHKNLSVLYREALRDPQRAEEHWRVYQSLGGR